MTNEHGAARTPAVRGPRRRRALPALAAGAAVVLLAAGFAVYGSAGGPHEPVDAVPASLDLPWPWQATVQMDPPGQAALLYGGDALRGTDLFDAEGKLAVVGRTGTTRTLLYAGADAISAGVDVLLSPDGRRVAQAFLQDAGVDGDGLVVTDLDTGRSVTVPGPTGAGCCTPVAWAPDGEALLATQDGTVSWVDGHGAPERRFVLLDLATGTSTVLSDYLSFLDVRAASQGAFAPDGAHLVLSEGTTLRMVDRAGATVWSRDLGPRRHLAGVGAFTPDGTRITTVTLEGCFDHCDEAALAARRWTFGYLDAATGADASGPTLPPVTGMAVRALGWIRGAELAVLRYEPERGVVKETSVGWDDVGWWETGHVTLLGLTPGRAPRTVFDPPDGVLTLDVPADLLTAGRFDGPPSHASPIPVRVGVLVGYLALTTLVSAPSGALVAIVALAAHHWRSRRRVALRQAEWRRDPVVG